MMIMKIDLTSVDINLNLDNNSPEITIEKLEVLTEERSLWKQRVKDTMT